VNDVRLTREVWVVTGSNMSGKTTLLRAAGLNTVLALAGLPVCAKALKLSMLAPLTSMRVKDSLERGVSYFYAEVQRIKAVLDAAKTKQGLALFLLDELLMGTNTRERQIASRRLLELLRDAGAIGGVTTHDLVLTETPGVHNVHFRDDVKDGQMMFDYRLREGVVETTNALKLLEAAGVPLGTLG
jgi:DNA mismatch repair ATPase MutS